MSENRKRKILHITYIAENAYWFNRVFQKMNDTQKEKYKKARLHELRNSILLKLYLVKVLIPEINLEAVKIYDLFKRNNEKVNNCINGNFGFSFRIGDNRIYRILAFIEAILIELKSATDLIIKYFSKFYTHIFLEKKGEKSIIKELENSGVGLAWREELNYIRCGFLHHYSGWVSFEKLNNTYKLLINLPKSVRRFKQYQKFPYDELNEKKINEILNEFSSFNDGAFGFLVKKIHELS